MSEAPIHQPHDKLFKASFSDPVNAAAFLRWEVPPALSGKIAWEQLRVEPGSFVDSHYRHSESDLLFSAKLAGSDSLLYLLFEHQITPDPTLALRLLRYMVRTWEAWLKQHPAPARLPVILPIVLAQNAEVWELSPRFASLLDLPAGCEEALAPFVPDFTFRLIQLAALPFEAIRGTPAGIMTLRVMKAERVAQLLAEPVWDEALLLQVPRATFELLLRYLLRADIDKDAFDRKLDASPSPDLKPLLCHLLNNFAKRVARKESKKTFWKPWKSALTNCPQACGKPSLPSTTPRTCAACTKLPSKPSRWKTSAVPCERLTGGQTPQSESSHAR